MDAGVRRVYQLVKPRVKELLGCSHLQREGSVFVRDDDGTYQKRYLFVLDRVVLITLSVNEQRHRVRTCIKISTSVSVHPIPEDALSFQLRTRTRSFLFTCENETACTEFVGAVQGSITEAFAHLDAGPAPATGGTDSCTSISPRYDPSPRDKLQSFAAGIYAWITLDDSSGDHEEERLKLREAKPQQQTGSELQVPPESMSAAHLSAGVRRSHAKKRSIGDYHVLQEIGRGGEAVVYTAMHNSSPGDIVVLKALRPTILQQLPPSRRPESVAKVLREIKHKAVVKFYDCFIHETDDPVMPLQQICITMEYCRGGDVMTKIFQLKDLDERIPEKWLLMWLMSLLEALEYMHAKRVVHRDIKPENIFLTEDMEIKLGDFGASRFLNANLEATTFVGTPCYMAPEMYQRPLRYTSAVDLWCVGCVAFELTSPSKFIFQLHQYLQPGFALQCRGDAPEKMQELRELEAEKHASLSSLMHSSVTEGYKDLVFSMLRAIPGDRPSAAELLRSPVMVQAKKELSERSLNVGELRDLLHCRSFHWKGTGPWVHMKRGDITCQDCDVIVVPQDGVFSFSGRLAEAVVAKYPQAREQLREVLAKRPDGLPQVAEPVCTEVVPGGLQDSGGGLEDSGGSGGGGGGGGGSELQCAAIFYVVGPTVSMQDAKGWLVKTFSACLALAGERCARRICFPAIGTGAAGLSAAVCAEAFFESVQQALPESIDCIVMLCSDARMLQIFNGVYENIISTGQ